GGGLFVDSADKAARFIMTCNAFHPPLTFLADVPGFMIGKEVERQGIIRHGAKMISAVSEATVPKLSVIVRKAYGAALYTQIQEIEDPAERERFVNEKREEYAADIDILHLASELVVDAVIEPDSLRDELVRRYALAETKRREFSERRNPITPA